MLPMEKSRAGRRSNNNQSFHVLPRLVIRAEDFLQKEIGLDRLIFKKLEEK